MSRRPLAPAGGSKPWSGPAASAIHVAVDDADSSGRTTGETLGHSIGQEIESSRLPSHTDITFRSNGVDGVAVRFTADRGRLWLSGFDLRETRRGPSGQDGEPPRSVP